MLKVTILVGNPKPQSRTLKVAETLVHELLAPGTYDLRIIDLAEHSGQIFTWPSTEMAELNQAVSDSDLVIVASPTYKATYTGLLKGFLDRYPANGLRGVTAIPVMTGADATHSMGADVTLRPLLVELGASVPTRALYFITGQMDRMEEIVSAWAAENLAVLRMLQPLVGGMLTRHPRSIDEADVSAIVSNSSPTTSNSSSVPASSASAGASAGSSAAAGASAVSKGVRA